MARRYREFFESKTVCNRSKAARQKISSQLSKITADLQAEKISIGQIAERYGVNLELLRTLAEGHMGIDLEARQARVTAYKYEQRAKAADAKLDMDYIQQLIDDPAMTSHQICTHAGINLQWLKRPWRTA